MTNGGGLAFPDRLKIAHSHTQVDERNVNLTAGIAVSAEITTGSRRVIEYFLSPRITTINEGLAERQARIKENRARAAQFGSAA